MTKSTSWATSWESESGLLMLELGSVGDHAAWPRRRRGSFAVVRKARSRRDGTDWAVKVIDKGKLDKEDEEALRVEVAILQRVDHPNIVHLRQVFDTPKTFYMVRGGRRRRLPTQAEAHPTHHRCCARERCHASAVHARCGWPQVMELMTGGELFDRIVAKSKYSEAEAAATVAKIADALVYCHDRGIVHR